MVEVSAGDRPKADGLAMHGREANPGKMRNENTTSNANAKTRRPKQRKEHEQGKQTQDRHQ